MYFGGLVLNRATLIKKKISKTRVQQPTLHVECICVSSHFLSTQ